MIFIKCVLSFEYPPITSYTTIAYMMSILWVHKKNIMPWFCDHYIQLMVKADEKDWLANFYDAEEVNRIHATSLCPFCKTQVIDISIKEPFLDGFTNYVEQQIEQSNYIYVGLNQFYLSCSIFYNKINFNHGTFIYGYNRSDSIVMISGFFDNSKYVTKVIPYDEVNKGFINNYNDETNILRLLKYEDYDYKFNMNLMKISLNDYLNCRDSLVKFEYAYTYYNRNKPLFGLNCYDAIIERANVNQLLDVRAFHVLYDHKVAMRLRLDFLNQKNLISTENICTIYNRCEELIVKTMQLRNLVIKYNMNKDKELLRRINENCIVIKRNDKEFITELLDSIK